MLKIGLTGGIGSGKSTVADMFAELGVTIIDADKIAHQLTEKGSPLLSKIFNRFGDSIINDDQSLNRATLSQIIFKNKPEKKWLEDCLHPEIISQMLKETKTAQSHYCILVIPLLIEAQLENIVDRILVIDTPDDVQIQRSKSRDKKTTEQIKAVMNAQSSRQEKLAAADDVICNDSSLETLKQAVLTLHEKYLAS